MGILQILFTVWLHQIETEIEKVDVNAEHIIISVKEVGYSLKTDQE